LRRQQLRRKLNGIKAKTLDGGQCMSEFEYLAVFVSIIFGISVTHILAGAIRSIYRAESS
jgi:hypothetical protein